MDVMPLLRRIDLQLVVAGLSERAACIAAHTVDPDVNVDFIRDIRRRQHDPKVGKLMTLAMTIGTDLVSLLVDYPATQMHSRLNVDDVSASAIVGRRQQNGPGLQALVATLGGPEKGEVVKEPSELALLRFWRSLDEAEKLEVIELLGR